MLSVNKLLFHVTRLAWLQSLTFFWNPQTSRRPGLAVANTYGQVQQSHLDLHDGSRRVGACLKSDFKSHSANGFGDDWLGEAEVTVSFAGVLGCGR
jgi:hypothetical protein